MTKAVPVPAVGSEDRVSVCIATYNGARFLRQQIDSILPQLRAGDEIVVSDDGSSDGTLQLIASYGSAVRRVGDGRAGGVVANFARALKHARNGLIVLADQDDVWVEGRLDVMRLELRTHDLVLTNAWVVDEALSKVGATLFDRFRPSRSFFRNAYVKNSFVGCCMGFRAKFLRVAMPFPRFTPWHDWLIGTLICACGRVSIVQSPLLLYRRHGANASLTGETSSAGVFAKLMKRLRLTYALGVCAFRLATARV